ncbi:hypothetical protein OOK31_25485 [Streptomyces sp. NBC_00249]|uniref:hypothetical protein n=1 Tax=Streptomyces sp. NBC_00249 TaxID=2975690 RepID=UPI00225BB917|nr:hypothetical protein [Streptomyces sp. NBC_00249]MCX5197210.1 hypothetical protein [Streptomyces sp. NBC_00249]
MNTSFTSTALTGAGLAIGLALLVVEHARWWKTGGGTAAAGGGGSRDPKALVPFWSGIAFGTLMVACPAGLLGTAAGALRWGGNSLGDFVMSTMTGQRSTVVGSASAPQLDANGALIVTALVIVLFLMRKQFAKIIKRGFKSGVWTGTLLAIGTGTFALIGNLVVPNVNSLGAQLLGKVVHGTFL